jgi:nitrite reductase/ring-hydroxylating ferredoxin subunit/alkylhydroperoxidase/carboxymuconolactone decarboxylase family protein YurZ
MSDALDYLLKARPDALKPYFQFLKAAGSKLDPKTRAIISVITKVATQTERGFKQYLMRALREGVTPPEILDALLMAFPVLGLSKIVWAVDILLAMDIPEFRPEALEAQERWRDIGACADLTDGVSYRDCEDRSLFIYRQRDMLKVYDSRCPHQVTRIPELALQDCRLTCPKHGWVFDIATGECVDKGDRPLRQFAHTITDGRLMVRW